MEEPMPLPTDEDPLLGLIGIFDGDDSTPHGDVAANHDAYLADFYEEKAGSAGEKHDRVCAV
jgi:hypothetical protein